MAAMMAGSVLVAVQLQLLLLLLLRMLVMASKSCRGAGAERHCASI